MQGAVLVPSIVVPVVLLLALAAYVFDRKRTKAARAQWTIHSKELLFDDPYTVRMDICMCVYMCVYVSVDYTCSS